MTGMEHAIEQVAAAVRPVLDAHAWVLDGVCACGLDLGAEHGKYQQARRAHTAEVVARALAEAGWLAPAPLTEIRAENQFGETHRRWATDWIPVDRAEGDGRADCGCAYCHTGLFPIMPVCADCGSKRCPRAIHHANPCDGSADQ